MPKPILPYMVKEKKRKKPIYKEILERSELKESKDVVACVFDYGTFICLAEKLAETYKKVYYYTPTSQEFYSIEDLAKSDGIPGVERVFDIFDPEFVKEVDLFIFPDIGYGGLQKYLRSIGKAVWGSMGADELETIRTEFMKVLKKLKLPTIHTETIQGLTNLREHLKGVENKWIKVNKYRGNMETWHHIDEEHSASELDRLATEFGGLKDIVTFIVQDYISTDIETGYDGWCIDGKFPSKSFQGYEKKDELYLAALLDQKDLPKQIQMINEAMAPVLKEYSYRNFYATEIRIKDDIPYFIDPTLRMPGMSGEQLTETCENIADVIWHGANGELIEPEFCYSFAATAMIHHKAKHDGWRVFKVPEEMRQWIKLCHHAELEGVAHFPPKKNDELGLVIGVGDSIEEVIEMIVENVKELDSEPVCCELDGFQDLIKSIEEAKKYGIHFTSQKIPDISKILP